MTETRRFVNSELTEGLGRRAWIKRCEAGYSLAEAARLSGISVAGLKFIESGRTVNPRPQTIRRLAGAYGCSVRELLAPEASEESTRPKTPAA